MPKTILSDSTNCVFFTFAFLITKLFLVYCIHLLIVFVDHLLIVLPLVIFVNSIAKGVKSTDTFLENDLEIVSYRSRCTIQV